MKTTDRIKNWWRKRKLKKIPDDWLSEKGFNLSESFKDPESAKRYRDAKKAYDERFPHHKKIMDDDKKACQSMVKGTGNIGLPSLAQSPGQDFLEGYVEMLGGRFKAIEEAYPINWEAAHSQYAASYGMRLIDGILYLKGSPEAYLAKHRVTERKRVHCCLKGMKDLPQLIARWEEFNAFCLVFSAKYDKKLNPDKMTAEKMQKDCYNAYIAERAHWRGIFGLDPTPPPA